VRLFSVHWTLAAGLQGNHSGHQRSKVMIAALLHPTPVTLPAPLSKWGQITCTPLGQMLTSHEGGSGSMPDASGKPVLIPAQALENAKQSTSAESYFTKLMSLK